MEITKKYFEKTLENLIKHLDEKFEKIDERFEKVDQRFDKVDQKFDEQTGELKDYVHESFEVQQGWIDERFEELITVYDVRDRVSLLEKEVLKLKLHR